MSSRPPQISTSATSRFDPSATQQWVQSLCAGLAEQIQRALGVSLDMTPTSLAYIDHYLSQARQEQRSEILSLLSAQAGAYFGEIIRARAGAFWLGESENPRRLRLFLHSHWIYMAPSDIAYEAILADSIDSDDPRHPAGPALDAAFHLDRSLPEGAPKEQRNDADWIEDRLAETPALPADQFYSLTGRFETLELILELLSAKRIQEGVGPKELDLQDYLSGLDV